MDTTDGYFACLQRLTSLKNLHTLPSFPLAVEFCGTRLGVKFSGKTNRYAWLLRWVDCSFACTDKFYIKNRGKYGLHAHRLFRVNELAAY